MRSYDSNQLGENLLGVPLQVTVICWERAIFVQIVVSSLICFLPSVLTSYNCCLVALLHHLVIVAMLIYSSWRDEEWQQSSICTLSLVLGCLFLLLWGVAAYLTYHPFFWYFSLLGDDCMDVLATEHQRRLQLMPGPVRECYESSFFRKKCEDALCDVIDNNAVGVNLEDIVRAGQQITLNPRFLDRPDVRQMIQLHSRTTMDRSQAFRVLSALCVFHLERCGSYVPAHCHYNILQLPVDGTNIVIAKRQYEDLCARWSIEGTEKEISNNLEILRHSFDVVAQYLKTKYFKHH